MRTLALLLCLLAGRVQAAQTLTTILSAGPNYVLLGDPITVTLQVQNNGASTANSVTPTLEIVDGGFGPVLLAGPLPPSRTLAASATGAFTWTFSASAQCGSVIFSGSARGYDASNVTQTSNVSASSLLYAACSYTPTPSISPTLTVTPSFTPTPSPTAGSTTATPTQTPWIILATATAGPTQGDASIPGNIFHPNAGQPLQLRFYMPLDGGISIDLYDRTGRLVHHVQRTVGAGTYTELWDGTADNGQLVSTGIYVAQFKGKGLFKTVKFAVIK